LLQFTPQKEVQAPALPSSKHWKSAGELAHAKRQYFGSGVVVVVVVVVVSVVLVVVIAEHVPASQPWPVAQAFPHVPQLFESVCVSVQVVVSQPLCPLGQQFTCPLGQQGTHA
jgi:hypothetical protein